jgi:hypothetical protein
MATVAVAKQVLYSPWVGDKPAVISCIKIHDCMIAISCDKYLGLDWYISGRTKKYYYFTGCCKLLFRVAL